MSYFILTLAIVNASLGTRKAFSTNDVNQVPTLPAVSFTGDNSNPLLVDFQVCVAAGSTIPNTGYGSISKFTGRLYVPSTGQCVTVDDGDNLTPPFHPTLGECYTYGTPAGPGYSQAFALREDGDIYYVRTPAPTSGFSGTDVSCFQVGQSINTSGPTEGGCTPGFLGYGSDSTGNPTVDANGHIVVTCASSGSTPFVLAATL